MDLNNLLKLAGLAAQSPAANTEVEEDVPGKANTRPDPQMFPDGPSNLGSVSDTSLRRYLKAKGQPVSVEETTYPDYSVEEVLESYVEYTAEKAKNPYAIGMASAMKTTGDKPPLKKSTINKAHKIAKGIGESSLNEAAWKLEGGKTHMVGGNLNYDDKLEYLLSDEDADILNNFFAQADDAEKSKVWNMFWDHEEMGHDAEGPELAIQYAKDVMGMNEAEGHDPGWHPDPLDFRGWYTTNPAEIPSYMRSTERGKKSLASKNVSKLKSHIKGSLGKHRKANLPEDDEAMSGTYARVIYDYSEDFGMITLYNNGNKIDEWSGYFGADTVGNPLAAKFVEIAKKNGLNPEGMSIVDDEGEKGTFGNNTFNWDQFANDATGMNEAVAKIACTKCDEVSTAAAWNKNHDTCPKCKTSKQGVAEAAKPDFLDMDKDGDKKEPMKKAVADKKTGAVKEAAKPDFLDMDKDGNKKEPMKKAVKDKEKVSESIAYLKRLAGL